MEIFGYALPYNRNINGLPYLSLFSFPVDIILYCVVAVSLVLILLKFEKEKIQQIIIGGWVFFSVLYTFQAGFQVYHENRLLGEKNIDELREITTADGFYSFLKNASRNIPAQEPVTLYTKAEAPLYRQKAPYFLYPHPIIDNAQYILIFDPKLVTINQKNEEITIDTGKELLTLKNAKIIEKFSDKRFLVKKDKEMK